MGQRGELRGTVTKNAQMARNEARMSMLWAMKPKLAV